MKLATESVATNDFISLFKTTPGCRNVRVLVMKGVGDTNDKKNIILPSHCFVTLINNVYAVLAENNNTDNDDLYTTV